MNCKAKNKYEKKTQRSQQMSCASGGTVGRAERAAAVES